MKKSSRIIIGFIAALASSVLVAVLAGCFYAVIIGNDAPTFLKASISGSKDALSIIFFVVEVTEIAALPIATLTLVFIGFPFFLISQKFRRVSLSYYVVSSFLISMAVVGLLYMLHMVADFLTDPDFYFALVSVLFAGPIATLTFWNIVRPDKLK